MYNPNPYYLPEQSHNFVLPIRSEFIRYENNRPDNHYPKTQSYRNNSDNFMIHFSDSGSEDQEFQGIEKVEEEMNIVENYTYSNANNLNNYSEDYNLNKNPQGLKVSQIREFEDENEGNLEKRSDSFQEEKEFRDEKEKKQGKPNENIKRTHEITFKVPEFLDESLRMSKLTDEAKEAAKYYLKILRIKLKEDNSKEILELFDLLKSVRYEGIEKYEDLMKNKGDSRAYLTGLMVFKAFINEKEELVSQINDNIAAEDCQEFIHNIFNYLQENIKSKAFQTENKSLLDEIIELLFQYDAKNQGISKCLVLVKNLRVLLEESLDFLLQNGRNLDLDNNPSPTHYQALEEDYLQKIRKLEDHQFHLENRLKKLEIDQEEAEPDNEKINKVSANDFAKIREEGKILKEEHIKLDQQINDKAQRELALKKEIHLIKQRIEAKRKGYYNEEKTSSFTLELTKLADLALDKRQKAKLNPHTGLNLQKSCSEIVPSLLKTSSLGLKEVLNGLEQVDEGLLKEENERLRQFIKNTYVEQQIEIARLENELELLNQENSLQKAELLNLIKELDYYRNELPSALELIKARFEEEFTHREDELFSHLKTIESLNQALDKEGREYDALIKSHELKKQEVIRLMETLELYEDKLNSFETQSQLLEKESKEYKSKTLREKEFLSKKIELNGDLKRELRQYKEENESLNKVIKKERIEFDQMILHKNEVISDLTKKNLDLRKKFLGLGLQVNIAQSKNDSITLNYEGIQKELEELKDIKAVLETRFLEYRSKSKKKRKEMKLELEKMKERRPLEEEIGVKEAFIKDLKEKEKVINEIKEINKGLLCCNSQKGDCKVF